MGLPIIDGFSKDEEGFYKGKRLTDPVKGLTVRGKVWLDPENPDQLKVRGYFGFFLSYPNLVKGISLIL